MGSKTSTLKPEVVNDLKNSTAFTHAEICDLYRQFKVDCGDKHSHMTEEAFRKMYEEVFPSGDSAQFASNIFKVYDKAGAGRIDFRQFITVLSVQLKGSLQDKLEWAFDVYDIENTGDISREEALDMIQSMAQLNAGILPAEERVPAGQLCDYIFQRADTSRTGRISKKEFVEAAMGSRTFQKILEGTTAAAGSPYANRKERSGSFGKPRSGSFRVE